MNAIAGFKICFQENTKGIMAQREVGAVRSSWRGGEWDGGQVMA